jgi:PDZ domain-containing secreted protein
MQPVYQYPPAAPLIDPALQLKQKERVITFLSIIVAVSVLLNALLGFVLLNQGASPIGGTGYKEYSSLAQVYKSAALGEKVKVSITTNDPNSAASGFVTLADSDKVGVIVRIPTALKNQIKLFYGRNIVYGQITERNGPSLYLDVDKIEP